MEKGVINNLNSEYFKLKINSKIYPIDVVSSVCYTMNEEAYFFLEGNPEKEIEVNIKTKNNKLTNKEIVLKFQENLITYLEYKNNFKNNKKIKEMIIQRAIITNNPGIVTTDKDFEEIENDLDNLFSEDELEEIADIATPWEEKNQ